MSELLVITFPARETAGQAADRLKSVQAAHGIDITDIAVVEKDADARIHVHHGLDKPTLGGAIGGGFLVAQASSRVPIAIHEQARTLALRYPSQGRGGNWKLRA